MKNPFLLLVLIITFISCDNQKRYQGQWTNYFLTDYDYNETKCMMIEGDSIKFNHSFFDYWNSYPLKIENNTLSFNKLSFETSIRKDTLSFNPSIHFIRDKYDTLYRYKPILKIKLPEISYLQNTDDINERFSFIYFGKRSDNNQFSLQLNDKYAEINEIPAFLAYERAAIREELIYFLNTILIIDESTPLKYVESIFHELKKINQLKIRLVNKLSLDYNDNKGLHYNYEGLNKKLPYFAENDFYVPKTLKNYTSPPPPPSYYPFFDDLKPNPKFIILKNNVIYHNNKTITNSELKSLAKQWVQNKNAIFSLYDLESTYGQFLKLTAIINSVYQIKRNELSKTKFKIPFYELSRDEMTSIKMRIPMYHVWSYSIPHYKHIIENNKSFFGLEVPSLEELSI